MPKIRSMHPSEEALERYSLGQFTEVECATLEDHLLICIECQETLTRIDAEVSDIKQVCQEVAAEPEPISKPGLFARFSMATPMWAAAAAAIVIAVAVPVYRQTTAPRGQSDVILEASRGSAPVAEAKAGNNLKLNIDLTQISAQGPYRVAIVGSDGQQVWSAEGIRSSGRVTLDGPNNLGAGNYWVRIYGSGTLLREYGMLLK